MSLNFATASARERERDELLKAIERIHAASRGTYGSPRVTRALRQAGTRVSENRVARLNKIGGRSRLAGGAGAPSARRRLARFVRALMYRIPLAIVLWAGFLGPVSIAAGEPKRHVLDVYGDGFAFEVREPPGWFVDSTIASEFGASVIFYPTTRDPYSPGTPVIRVVVAKKISEDTGAALKHAMDYYRSRYDNVEFRNSAASHPRYRAYSKLFCLSGKFCEYVTYLNPGAASRFLLLVALTRPKHAATSTELAAYKRVVASLDAN